MRRKNVLGERSTPKRSPKLIISNAFHHFLNTVESIFVADRKERSGQRKSNGGVLDYSLPKIPPSSDAWPLGQKTLKKARRDFG
jgi:hypothetical protein